MAKARRAANGDGSIYQRETDKRWVGCFIVNGKRKYVYGKTHKEAREKLRKAQQEHAEGTLVDASKLNVKDYLNYWARVHGAALKLTTDRMYRSRINKHLIPALGYVQLQKLTHDHIQTFYGSLVEKKLKASTIHFIHLVLNAALADAVEWGKLGKNPCSKVTLPREEETDIMPLTQEQAHILLQAAEGHQYACLITLALATGMRQGELLALHWSDIDVERKSIRIGHTLSYTPEKGLYESEPKTASSKRSLVLAQFALDALKAHRTRQRAQRLQVGGARWQEKGLVFCNGYGGYIWAAHLQKAFKRLLQGAGLPAIRFHDLRHTAAVALIMKGVHPKVIQEILGHSSIVITMDIYGHVFPSMQRDAMENMDDFLTGKVAM